MPGKIDPGKLKRAKPEMEDEPIPEPPKVSAGAVEKALDLAFNPTREKLPEVTIIDRVQGRLFPQLNMVNFMRHYCLEIAYYREDVDEYRQAFNKTMPTQPDPLDELLYRTAQWQKSVQGINLTKITDIALAETEARAGEEEDLEGKDIWKE